MHVSSGDKVCIQRYLDRHTYNNDYIPRCRYMIPTSKVCFQAIPTDVSVTILLYFEPNTYKYLHGRYILKKYLLIYVSLSCCICCKIPAHTFICICLYFLDKYIYIHADPAGRDARVFIPNQRGPQSESWSS